MPDDRDFGQIELVLTGDGANAIDSHIQTRSAPLPGCPNRRYSMFHVAIVGFERIRHCAEILGFAIGGLEATAVNQNDERVRSGAIRNTQFAVLIQSVP